MGACAHGDEFPPLHRSSGSEGPALLSLAVVPALLLPESQPAGVTFWVGIVAVGFCLDLVARRSDGRLADAEELLRFISTSQVGKVLLVIVWSYAGYHLFAH